MVCYMIDYTTRKMSALSSKMQQKKEPNKTKRNKMKKKWSLVSSFLFEIELETIKGKRRKMTVLNHSSFDDST